ncbi:MAG: glycine-rich domain-containing protein, partial [Patescibacteria group bacterium]
STAQTKSGSLAVNGLRVFTGSIFDGTVQIKTGTPAEGKVLTSDATGLVRWEDPATGSTNNYWTKRGKNIWYGTTSEGKVGVGTGDKDPDAKLHVQGNFKVEDYSQGVIETGMVLTAMNDKGLAKWAKLPVGGGGGEPGSQTPWTQDVNANGFKLYGNGTLVLDSSQNGTNGVILLNTTRGGVIIGGSNYGYTGRALHVAQDINGTMLGQGKAQLFLSGSTQNADGLLLGYQSTAGFTFLQSTTNQNLALQHLGGNVGIGTSTPTSKLTVAGMIETTKDGIKFPDDTVQTTASTTPRIARYSVGQYGFNNALYTFTVPDYITKVWITMSGGGGGGGCSNASERYGGGGGGAHAILAQQINVTPGENVNVQVGGFGIGGISGGGCNGTAGGDSKFGTLIVQGGGGGERYLGSGHGAAGQKG